MQSRPYLPLLLSGRFGCLFSKSRRITKSRRSSAGSGAGIRLENHDIRKISNCLKDSFVGLVYLVGTNELRWNPTKTKEIAMTFKKLANRVAVVTGASKGIGAAIA